MDTNGRTPSYQLGPTPSMSVTKSPHGYSRTAHTNVSRGKISEKPFTRHVNNYPLPNFLCHHGPGSMSTIYVVKNLVKNMENRSSITFQ
jgi:hypothetical protein